MDYSITAQSGNSYTHMWDVASTREFEGGFLFDKTTIPSTVTVLPKSALLKVDQTERKATLIKTAELYEAITALSTTVKIKKNSLLLATDVIGTSDIAVTVGTIDSSNADYDSFTIVADTFGALDAGTVFQTYDAAGASGKSAVNPDGMNYADVSLDTNPTCSVIYEAKGVVPSALYQPLTSAIKTALKFCQFLTV